MANHPLSYEIRPASPEDAAGISRLRRIPEVGKNLASNPAEAEAKVRTHLEHLGENEYQIVAQTKDAQGTYAVISRWIVFALMKSCMESKLSFTNERLLILSFDVNAPSRPASLRTFTVFVMSCVTMIL